MPGLFCVNFIRVKVGNKANLFVFGSPFWINLSKMFRWLRDMIRDTWPGTGYQGGLIDNYNLDE